MFNTRRWMERFDRWMIAVTFAEAGQREMALEALHEKPERRQRTVQRVKKNAEQRPVLRA
jgi:hypothetical protein